MSLSEQMKPDEDLTPKDITAQEMVKNLGEILSSEEGRKKVLNSILGKDEKRPAIWSGRSNAPYYRERFALELKAHLDEMMKDCEDRLYRYEDFTWINKNSLYLMLYQAFRYLIDKLDPDQRYRAFKEIISITREKDRNGNPVGVRFSIVKDIRTGVPTFKSVKISQQVEDTWREEMENFIEEAPENSVFLKDKISLSPEDIHELEVLLAQFPNILANITSIQIKLVKTSVDV